MTAAGIGNGMSTAEDRAYPDGRPVLRLVPTGAAKKQVLSPLRYPGAKRLLLPALRRLVQRPVDLLVEPFCGGASVSLAFLAEGLARHALLGDADPLVAAFWAAAVRRPEELIARMRAEPVTLGRWDYWRSAVPTDSLELATKCLFLNRTSFSGILHNGAGPIGGRAQSSEHRIDCRWPLDEMERRIRYVGALGRSGRIAEVVHGDWRATLDRASGERSVLAYIDPPYVAKGDALYGTSFPAEAHEDLATYLSSAPFPWILSYDDDPLIRGLYGRQPGLGRYMVGHHYSATGTRSSAARATELIVTSRPVPGCGLTSWGDDSAAPFGFRSDGEPRKRRPGPGRPPLPPEERAARRAESSRRWREAHRDTCADYAREYRRRAAAKGSERSAPGQRAPLDVLL